MGRGLQRDRFGAWLGFGAGAHVLFAVGAMALAPSDLLKLVQALRADQRAQLTTRFDLGTEAPPAPPAPPPSAPEPAVVEAPPATPSPPAPPLVKPPEPEVPTKAPLREAIENHSHRFFEAAADAVAQAGKALTREDEAGGDSIASGDSNSPMYGLVAGGGTGNVPTMNRRAKVGGKVGGHGESTRADAVLEPDLTRGAHVPSMITDSCDFPAEANLANINHAAVTVIVTILPSGHAGPIVVLDDPGHGFGRAAIACLRAMTYPSPRDRHGTLIQGDTPPTTIRFTR